MSLLVHLVQPGSITRIPHLHLHHHHNHHSRIKMPPVQPQVRHGPFAGILFISTTPPVSIRVLDARRNQRWFKVLVQVVRKLHTGPLRSRQLFLNISVPRGLNPLQSLLLRRSRSRKNLLHRHELLTKWRLWILINTLGRSTRNTKPHWPQRVGARETKAKRS